ncbi:synaptic vesicle glycoprotein 2C-like isoform X2 [Cylas formicarius]|nr:synaptic vesicle glycoprotein 2C-like isoform X2 [Cylas formicarius]XP_060523635.1 synaptic vesicle glycoprotein 2C-like isoform X2 [Cylas formicarius]
MSYTSVVAKCDLNLGLSDKGFLNAATYAGMVSSASAWGFLFDVLGRRKLLLIGFVMDGTFVVMSAFAQNLALLLAAKFFQGFAVIGPFAAINSYISEFHCSKYRSRFQLLIGSSASLGTLLLPLLAWALLSQSLDFSFLSLNFHSWNVFLLITALPSVTNAIVFVFLPESPKFLMAQGRDQQALRVLRTVYSINTGRSPDSYPVKKLVDEPGADREPSKSDDGETRTKFEVVKAGFSQIKPIFYPPHLQRLILVCFVTFFIVSSMNMLRLWLPHIFQAVIDYQHGHAEPASLCTMLKHLEPAANASEICAINVDNQKVYVNSIVVAFTSICGYAVTLFVLPLVGKKTVLVAAELISGSASICLYFAQSSEMVLVFSSAFNAMGALATNVIVSVTVDLFPTTLRTLAISMGVMVGRAGAMGGNFVFPFLLQSGCLAPFFVVGGLLIAAACLSLLFPKTDTQALH